MKKLLAIRFFLFIFATGVFISCGSGEQNKPKPASNKPLVKNAGNIIEFPSDSTSLSFFKTEIITKADLNAELMAPAHVAATVTNGASQPLILFEDPELSASYTAMLQNRVNIRQKAGIILQKNAIIRQKKIELTRFTDLAEHGAGTGKDVADAQTDLIEAETGLAVAQNELANEKTAILEHEARLKLAGFNPQALLKAPAGKVWAICDIPENQINKIKENGKCSLQFSAYPGKTFSGTIEEVADVVDNTTRMVKLRIAVGGSNDQLRSGMFATVSFGITEGVSLSVPSSAVVTVQGKSFVFIKKSSNSFEKRELTTGAQINNRIIVYGGLEGGEEVVSDGAMQLKGISFGY